MEKIFFNSLNNYFKKTFGEKVYKLSIDAGFTCPNRDGKISEKGCIFCSENGSGDFTGNKFDSITKQIISQKNSFHRNLTGINMWHIFKILLIRTQMFDILEKSITRPYQTTILLVLLSQLDQIV